MKFVIAGLGSIGRRHLRNLAAVGEKDIVLYRTRKATLPDQELEGYPVVDDLQAALASKPDGVVVSNPTSLHLDTSIAAANQGCHILLEKPISHNLDRINELSAAVEKNGSKVLVGFQFRFHPTLQLAKEKLLDGAIGRPVSVRAHWGEYLPNWHPWENHQESYAARQDLGGGVVLTLCHPLDYLRWIFGEVDKLWAFTQPAPELGTAVDAVAEIGLAYQSGVLGSVHLDYLRRPGVHGFEITGTEGLLRWDNQTSNLEMYRAATQVWQTFSAPDGFERNWLFMDEIRSFIAMIKGQSEPVCTLVDGIRALQLAQAVHTSVKEEKIMRMS